MSTAETWPRSPPSVRSSAPRRNGSRRPCRRTRGSWGAAASHADRRGNAVGTCWSMTRIICSGVTPLATSAATNEPGAGPDVDVELVDRAVDRQQVERPQRPDLVHAAGEAAAAEDQRGLRAPAPAALGRFELDDVAHRARQSIPPTPRLRRLGWVRGPMLRKALLACAVLGATPPPRHRRRASRRPSGSSARRWPRRAPTRARTWSTSVRGSRSTPRTHRAPDPGVGREALHHGRRA